MATELIASLDSLTLTTASTASIQSLPFRPSPYRPLSQSQLDNVDRYLFRLFDLNSEGFNDEIWVRSRDAHLSKRNWNVDILLRQDLVNVASMLSRHLWWEGKNDEDDNLVSWTSSLLFVLQYAFYRHQHHGTGLNRMFICVVDTSKLPTDVFLRDTDLIREYSQFYDRLAAMQRLRCGRHYFGEFLSQGVVRIEGNCSIVSIQDIIDTGLMQLRPEFEGFETRPATWANQVVNLRRMDTNGSVVLPIDENHVEIAMHIGDLFGRRWKWPIVLACLALKPWHDLESQVMKALQQPKFAGRYSLHDSSTEADPSTDVKTLVTSPQEMKVSASADLPEVMRVDEIMRMVYTNLRLDEAHRKSSHRDCAGTSTETTAPEQKDGRSLPRGSFETPVFYWTEKKFLENHCRTISRRPREGSWRA